MFGNNFKLFALCLVCATLVSAQTDPGARGGPSGAGRPLPGLSDQEMRFFQDALMRFQEVNSVSGAEPGAEGSGLGPRFNLNSCSGCHAQPDIGGTSPAQNPQVAAATEYGAQNTVPAFIQPDGPVRVVRFRRGPNGEPDGGVHALFVISGRADAGTCAIVQPDFDAAVTRDNAVFRIPTPVFGAGLVEMIPDGAIVANRTVDAQTKQRLGIQGHENRSANDGTITRFGWKAQNKSLAIFAAEAYNVEIGVTNEIFPSERDQTPNCLLNPTPEDGSSLDGRGRRPGMSDVATFAGFMRFLAPPIPAPDTPSIAHGRQVFSDVGCALCHTPSFRTGNSSIEALSNKPVPLYSDLLVHRMGGRLDDGVLQGQANGQEWRTAPLWGLGQRLFFLHDGRTADLVEAIQFHASPGSEANAVIQQFAALPADSKQDLLNFLRSL